MKLLDGVGGQVLVLAGASYSWIWSSVPRSSTGQLVRDEFGERGVAVLPRGQYVVALVTAVIIRWCWGSFGSFGR